MFKCAVSTSKAFYPTIYYRFAKDPASGLELPQQLPVPGSQTRFRVDGLIRLLGCCIPIMTSPENGMEPYTSQTNTRVSGRMKALKL